jgi:predicted GNAT superfamily acetyltransferase
MPASRRRYGGAVPDSSAEGDLARAQERAGVEVRSLHDLSDLDDARRVFDDVWPAGDGSTQVPGNLMKAMVHAGGYVSAAYRDGVPIGAAMGFVGRHRHDDHWQVHLHSHMAAVLDPYRDQHIGTALKKHQRVWAIEQGIDTIVWTFDPLVRRNARVNLIKLGVEVRGFEPDFYGVMDDGINSGDPTDRLFAWWQVTSERAYAAAAGRLVDMDPVELVASGRDVVTIDLPDDIVALRARDRDEALRWRLAVRHELTSAFAEGFTIVGVSPTGGYVLERPV